MVQTFQTIQFVCLSDYPIILYPHKHFPIFIISAVRLNVEEMEGAGQEPMTQEALNNRLSFIEELAGKSLLSETNEEPILYNVVQKVLTFLQ